MVHDTDAALSTSHEGAGGQPPRSRSVPYLVQLLSNDIATGPISLGRHELQPMRPQSIIFHILSGTIYTLGC
jgi:hypothetical protein